jgi:hypothetical protein
VKAFAVGSYGRSEHNEHEFGEIPYQKRRRRVLGCYMTYVEVGRGHPIVLLRKAA